MAQGTAPALRQMRDQPSSDADALLWHDVRAAITDVIGGTELIDDSRLDPQSQLQLQRIQIAGEMLAQLITQLEQAQNGEASGQVRAVRLFEFVRNLERRWGARAAGLGRELTVEITANLPPVIEINPLKLNRILSNLLANAIVHGRSGPVNLRLDLRSDQMLRITVRDHGPGFSNQSLAAVFEGEQLPASKLGSGRGLLIARELAQQLGGRATFSNGPEGGAEVALLLPPERWRVTAEAMAETLGDRPDHLPNLDGFRVLIAEDNATNQLVISQMLERLGAEHKIAENGIVALELAKTGAFDLGLIDIEMPGLSGIEVIEAIRAAGDKVAKMPLLAITAYVLRTHRDRIYEAGADGILAKPIMGLQPFGEALSALLSRTTPAEQDYADVLPFDGAMFDPARLSNLLDISGPAMGEELMSRLNRDFAEVQKGLCLPEGGPTLDAIRRHTHVLVSLSGAIGADHMLALAQTLNEAAHRDEPVLIQSRLHETTAWLDRLIAAFRKEMEHRMGGRQL